jgi:CubicO group peptidase (beta-lactamase class C family)
MGLGKLKGVKIIGVVCVLLLLLYGLVWVSPYKYLIKGVRLTYLVGESSASYLDWKGFSTRVISNNPENKIIQPVATNNKSVELSKVLEAMLTKTEAGSYLVYRNDTLVCEKYFGPISDTTKQNSFSMAKSITTLLVQKAIQEGYINSWDDKVKKYVPWLSGPFADSLTLRHLSTMTAGLNWDEGYASPFGITAKVYYSDNVEGVMRTIDVLKKPGEEFQYQSGSTQLLSFVLQAAIQNTKTLPKYGQISDYASEKLWKELGMEASALWSLDRQDGKELGFCCVNAISRDFGKLGLLALHQGKTATKSIIDSTFFSLASKPYKSENYGHSFWLSGTENAVPFYYYQGLKGQYICIIPSKNMVVVRTGNGIDRRGKQLIFECVKTYVNEAVALFGQK